MSEVAKKIIEELNQLADAIRRSEAGDEEARQLLIRNTDNRRFGLLVGVGEIQQITDRP